MKKLYYSLAVLASILFATRANAQVDVRQNSNSMQIAQSSGEEIVSIVAADNSSMQIKLAGVVFEFAPNKKPEVIKPKRRHYESRIQTMELGLIDLTGTDYSLYKTSDPTFVRGFMSLDNSRSLHVAINLATVGSNITNNGVLGLSTGIGIACNNFVFDNHVTLAKDGYMVHPATIDNKYKKSKLVTTYVTVPIMIDINLTRHFFVSAGVYGNILLDSHTKIKFPKQKEHNMYVAPLQYGLSVHAGYDSVYIYCNYNRTPLFKADQGPKTYPVMFGIGFGF